MPKEEWGVKRICPTTGKRFYDLNKTPIVSPYTGETVTFDTNKNRMMVADAADSQSKVVADKADEDAEDVIDDAEIEIEDDDDVLEDDDDDSVSLDELTDVAAEDDET